jgi:hypothetical protein
MEYATFRKWLADTTRQAITILKMGNLAHTAQNKTKGPLRVLVVDILPKDWTGPAVIAAQ